MTVSMTDMAICPSLDWLDLAIQTFCHWLATSLPYIEVINAMEEILHILPNSFTYFIFKIIRIFTINLLKVSSQIKM